MYDENKKNILLIIFYIFAILSFISFMKYRNENASLFAIWALLVKNMRDMI